VACGGDGTGEAAGTRASGGRRGSAANCPVERSFSVVGRVFTVETESQQDLGTTLGEVYDFGIFESAVQLGRGEIAEE
jgi:hypothetical protein